MATQVMQSGVTGVPQATIPVQIPISTAGGQTVLQTIPFPVQIPVIPNVVQANGQTLQVMPQLAQVSEWIKMEVLIMMKYFDS